MKILLTGATGFLGSHLLKAFLSKGYEVVILKRSFSDTSRICDVLNKRTTYDIDKISLSEVFEKEKHIDCIFHAATNYGRNNEDFLSVFRSNVEFPTELLSLSVKYNIFSFFNIDTSLNFNKSSLSLNYYSLAKHQFFQWGHKVANDDKINFCNIILEHMYGPNDSETKFTTYLINGCKNNVERLALTSGEQERDFIYIDDVVSACLLLIEKQSIIFKSSHYAEFQVGSGKAIKVKDFALLVKEITKSKTYLDFGAVQYREGEIMFSQADISELSKLGWLPKFDVSTGLHDHLYIEEKNNN